MKVTIIETRRIRSTNPANAAGLDTLVTYTDEAQRFHSVIVEGIDPTPEAMAAAIQSDQAEALKHAGRTLDI